MLNVSPPSRSTRRIAFLIWSLLILPPLASAQTTTVSAVWDSNSSSDNVSNYEVCIGTSSLSCNIDLATVSASDTSYAFAPPAGQLVYVAVRAVNASGRSAYSAEQRFSIPSLNTLTNRTTLVSALISPINLAVSDPDGSRLTFTHTGLPPGVSINSTTGQITGTPTSAGTYNVTIFVSDGLTTASRSFVWTVTQGAAPDQAAPTLSITSHTSGQVLTSASQTIRGTATDSGNGGSGIAAVRVNGQFASNGTASGSNSASWSRAITLTSGNNTISVEAVDGAGNIEMQQITLQLAVPNSSPTTPTTPSGNGGPLSLSGLSSSRTSPQAAGTSITFNATASGGQGAYQFKWWLFDGTAWKIVGNWGSASSYTWTPTQAGSDYVIGVWVRDSTMTADVGTYVRSMTFAITGTASGSSSGGSSSGGSSSGGSSTSAPLALTALGASRVSPQPAATPITFTATASGGSGPYQFKWWLYDGAAWTVVSNWSSSSTYTWTPTQARTDYVIGVWLRDSTMTADVGTYVRSMTFAITGTASGSSSGGSSSGGSSSGGSSTSAPLALTALSASRVSPQPVGTSITFTATASGGSGPYQFKWWLFDGTAWIVGRDWNSSATYAWTPTKPGTAYQIGVWVRDSTMTSDIGTYNRSMTFAISGTSTTSLPLQITSLTSNLSSPQRAGTRVTFTASATGGRPGYQYKWWVFDGTAWIVARDWSTSSSYTWTALPSGSNYFVGVWVRDSTTNANVGNVNLSVPFVTR